jgi:RNA polymerase sigma factor FliA
MSVAPRRQVQITTERLFAPEVYERFMALVRRTAIRMARKVPAHVSVSDLVGYGWLGLLEALSRAGPDLTDEEFEAYALYRVRGAMLDYLRTLDPASRRARTLSRRVTRAIRDLSQELGRQPDEHEIAEKLGMKPREYSETLKTVGEAGMARLELLDIDDVEPVSNFRAPDDLAGQRQLCEAVSQAIQKLPERLQLVLSLYYGEECTLKEIGALLDVSESRVSQLHSEAVHRLRAAIGRE